MYAPTLFLYFGDKEPILAQHQKHASKIASIVKNRHNGTNETLDCNLEAFSLSGSLLIESNVQLKENAVSGPFWVGRGEFLPD